MATMKTLNGYGFNAIEFNGKTSDSYLLKTDTVANSADSQKLGGKAPEYYIQPRNLLDNSDFRNPVNQRGQTSYAGGYGIDRWRQWNSSSTTYVRDGYITISIIQQYIGVPVDFDTVYTLAAKKTDGTILCLAGTFNTKDNIGGLRFDYDTDTDGSKKLYVSISAAGDYLWAALYEGEYTAETLPPYVPKGYAAELAECQRYYYTIKSDGSSYAAYATGVMNDASSAYFPIVFPIPMRIAPTLSYFGNFRVYSNSGGRPITAMSVDAPSRYSARVIIDNISGGVLGQACELQSSGDRTAFIAFSADL